MRYKYIDWIGEECYWLGEWEDMGASCKTCECDKCEQEYSPDCHECKYYISKIEVEKMVEDFQAK